MKKGTKDFIFYLAIVIFIMIESGKQFNEYEEQIAQLQQNQIEQAEEKEVYVNKCKIYEDMLKANGLLDECGCN